MTYLTIDDVQTEYVRLLNLSKDCDCELYSQYLQVCIAEIKEFACANFTPEEIVLMEYNAQASFVK